MPGGAVVGQSAAGDEAVNVRVERRSDAGAARPVVPTLFEPSLRLLGVTLRAGAVAAGVEDVQQGAAVIAAPLLSAECFGAAGDDVGDGATVRWEHRRAVSLHIAACEAAERVRHFGHASEAAHHLVEQLAQGP